MMSLLEIRNLRAGLVEENKEILKGVNLSVKQGEIHAIMGPNGSGKSTLANVIMGNPKYKVIDGEILFEGESILDLPVDERARRGIFLSFQYPQEIPGIRTRNFLISVKQFMGSKEPMLRLSREIERFSAEVALDKAFLDRYLNVGFSGGEKKKSEILQMAFLKPKLAILDEIDSGLDVDALKTVAEAIMRFKTEDMAIILITHYERLLEYIKPDVVHVYVDGRVIISDGAELARKVEEKGYGFLTERV